MPVSIRSGRIAELASEGIPSYALAASMDGDRIWRVYGGAYVDEREAASMAELLAAAGVPGELVERRGTVFE